MLGGRSDGSRLGFFFSSAFGVFEDWFHLFFLRGVCLALLWQKKRLMLKKELITFVPYSVVFVALAIGVGVLQNDLGQIVLLGAVLAVLLVFSGGSVHLFGLIISGAFAISVLAIVTSEHRILRLKLWWSNLQNSLFTLLPDRLANALRISDLPESYQVFHAGNAMHNGGLFGQGLGLGQIKLGFLSEVHTDMVLAGIAEEWGFLGLCVCFILFSVLIVLIFRIANRLKEPKYSLFCVGVVLLISFSLVINAFGVGGILPVKGLAVPFLSYGGVRF